MSLMPRAQSLFRNPAAAYADAGVCPDCLEIVLLKGPCYGGKKCSIV
jgi:hypothetical protein